MKKGLIASSYECPKCNEQMGLNERKSVVLDGFEWRCRKKGVNMHDKIPEGSELANMVAKVAKMVGKVAKMVTKAPKLAATLVAKNDDNLALPPRFRQVLIEASL
ncbi:hypothetical protein TNCV_916611 [Trichonephila clavipes]|nr:hypothetical protein TNCV_916611 [Trichonephila clavipes]